MKRIRFVFNLVTVISLFLGVIWLSPTQADAAPTFASLGQIRAEGLRVPGAMDLDAAGNLYVADARGGRVYKFSPYGVGLGSFDLKVTGRGLAVTPDGTRLYVSREQSVEIFDMAQAAIVGSLAGAETAGSEFVVAGEIDLDANGNVFVADVGGMQVKIFDASGQYLSRFGAAGSVVGQFRQIGGMTINPAGQVVVADSSALNGKVQVFTLNADLSVAGVVAYAKSSTESFGAPAMQAPRGFAFDAQGRGYFLEFMGAQVRAVNANFAYLDTYSRFGYEVGQLNNVIDAVFDDTNKRLFVGCDNGRIEVFGVDGGQNPVQVNHAPGLPVPQSPIGGSEVSTVNPVLKFANAVDSDGDSLTYQLTVLHEGAVVAQVEVAGAAGDATSVALTEVSLEENAAYSWTVQAFDGKASSAVSAAASFVVNAVDEAPSAPELLAPENNALVAAVDTLRWTASVDADPNDSISGYRVEVAGDADFAGVLSSQVVVDAALALGELQSYAQLEDGNSYYWRVTAFDNDQTPSTENPVGRFVYDTTQLTVTADVPDARVYLGGNHAYSGRFVGFAPLQLRDLPAGAMSVVVERAGFEDYVVALTLQERGNLTLNAMLTPALVVDDVEKLGNGINGRSGLKVDAHAAPFLVDFDNNGTLDLLVGSASGDLKLFSDMQVLRGGKLEFDQGVSLGLPVMPGAVPFVADWNNDGRKDLLVGLDNGTVSLFLNVGSEAAPLLAEGLELNAGAAVLNVGAAAAPAVLDYNADGQKDLLVGNAAGQVQLFINNGSDAAPQFDTPVILLTLSAPVVPMPVDWDEDGVAELMLTSAGVTTVYSLAGDGRYQPIAEVGNGDENFAGFAIDYDGCKGKDFFVGDLDGEINLWRSDGKDYVGSF